MTRRQSSQRQRRQPRQPRSTPIGREIIAGLQEALAFARGADTGARFRVAPISARRADAAPAPEFTARDVAAIRGRLGVSQTVFARLLNVSASTTRSWEQGVNAPGGAASRLLQVAQSDPDALLRYVRATGDDRDDTAKRRQK